MNLGIHIGSIVDAAVGADAIVNAGNPGLGLGSGVSGAIRDACGGHAFQVEVRERLSEEFDGELQADDCLSTSGGTSEAFRWVLHVASVDYRRPDAQTGGASGPNRIRTCTRAFLGEATTLAEAEGEPLVVATPLLGGGHGGLGPIVAMDVMLETVKRFLREAAREQPLLERLIFVVLKEQDASALEHCAFKHGLAVERRSTHPGRDG